MMWNSGLIITFSTSGSNLEGRNPKKRHETTEIRVEIGLAQFTSHGMLRFPQDVPETLVRWGLLSSSQPQTP